MTPQQQADEYLALWRTLRARGVPPENRLVIIDRMLLVNKPSATTALDKKARRDFALNCVSGPGS